MKKSLELVMKNLVSVFLTIILSGYSGSAQWTPERQIATKLPGSAQVSPDGRRIAYTVSEATMTADRSEYVTQIWLAGADGGEPLQLTYGDKSSANPKWSPDGSRIAFTSARRDNRSSLFVIRAAGGEAEQITDLKSGVTNFEWSPDGRSIAFTMADPKSDEEEKNEKSRNDFRWVDENPKMTRLWVVPVAKDASGRREPRKLTSEDRAVTSFDWSPDGKTIVYSHTKTSVANDWPTADVSIVEVAVAASKPVLNGPAAENGPRFSPDGKWIAVSVSDVPARWAQSQRLAVVPFAGGEFRRLAPTFDGQPAMIGWSGDGRSLYFTEARGTRTALYSIEIATDSIREIGDSAGVYAITLNASRDTFGVVSQSSVLPPEVYVSSVEKYAPRRITSVNRELETLPMPRTEVIRWKSPDGREIEGLLTYPIGYAPGAKVPLILNVHGGPAGVFQESFVGSRGVYPIATFAARGFAVLRPNPRGSSGYGVEFRRANLKDWGGRDYQDLMAGVDRVVAMGVADENRLGVMGWSYGGFMTSWIVTQTARFKAASAGAPVTNLISFVGTADIPAFVPDYFGGEFWDDNETYRSHSPIFFVKAATTPTLIQHGEADIRVPISQGYEFYNALRNRGVATRMLVLPRQPHGPTEPRMQLAAMQSNLDWFEKYIGKK
jgi:dipeptidyl aminopeptidase/acylaminoacyl peptidase